MRLQSEMHVAVFFIRRRVPIRIYSVRLAPLLSMNNSSTSPWEHQALHLAYTHDPIQMLMFNAFFLVYFDYATEHATHQLTP